MLRLEVTTERELRVVEILARPGSLASAAEHTGLTFNQVQQVATRHGYPDVAKLRAAVPALKDAAKAPDVVQALEDGHDPAAALAGRELRTVPVAALHPDPDNPRVDVGDVSELAESIRQSGLLQPIVVRDRAGALIIVAGHRRHAALTYLGVVETEVLVGRDMRADDALAAMLIENGHRRDLDPIEEARAIAKIKASKGWSGREIGVRIGRSQAFVDGRLALLALPADQQDQVRDGAIGITHAVQLGRIRTGTVRTHSTYGFHLGATHPLAGKARARCTQVHKLKARIVGTTACGECWESVIRADEQRTSLARSIDSGVCPTCEQPVDVEGLAGDLEEVATG
ncbi:ParB/RepB/Spo0J family partition protein [Oryzobacter sp. R7]|uniref:ParB/RepB/Spo0J family partition protein n=1 Tax=Oryzobacter faecalis TaxID=3388656 RepID=UPI00398D5C37